MKRRLILIGILLCLVGSSVVADDYVRETVEQANSRNVRYWNDYCKMRDEMIAEIDGLPKNRNGCFYWSDVNDTLMRKIATVDYYIWGIHELTMSLRDKGVQIPSFIDRAYERDKRWKEDNWFNMSDHQRQIILWIKPSEFIIPEITD